MVKPVPEGFHTITPSLIVKGGAAAIEFYKKAFGAVEIMRMPTPDGRVGHAELRIGDSPLFLSDEFPEMGNKSPLGLGWSPVTITLYLPDCDATFAQAVAAGAQVKMPCADMFWGDRFGKLTDPFGHEWALMTRKEELSVEEMGKRAAAAFSKPG